MPAKAVIMIENYSFTPKSVTVEAGGSVSFKHSKSSPKPEQCLLRFIDEEATGWMINSSDPQVFSREFPAPGRYEFFEENHVFMRGVVNVLAATMTKTPTPTASGAVAEPSLGLPLNASTAQQQQHNLAYLEYAKTRKQQQQLRGKTRPQQRITAPTEENFGYFGTNSSSAEQEEKHAPVLLAENNTIIPRPVSLSQFGSFEEEKFDAQAARDFLREAWEEDLKDESALWI